MVLELFILSGVYIVETYVHKVTVSSSELLSCQEVGTGPLVH
jgi:hypothetical protein